MASSYPVSIKTFQTFVDYQDVNYAENLNEIHDEVLAIEETLGVLPFSGLPTSYTSLNAALTDLYANKASAGHTHTHSSLQGDSTGNDHSQYALLSGATFTGPVTAPPAVLPGQLATLAQLQNAGLADQSTVQAQIDAELANRCTGAPSGSVPLVGRPAGYGWVLTGGYNEGCTGAAPAGPGQITCQFESAFSNCVQAFIPTKAGIGLGSNPFPNSYFPCTPYTPGLVEIEVVSCTLSSATVQFNNKDTGLPISNLVAFTWLAIGN